MAQKKFCLTLLLSLTLLGFLIDGASAQLSYPLDQIAPVTSSFDEFRGIPGGAYAHAGLDLDTSGGERVRAAKTGEGYRYGYDAKKPGYGLYLILKHYDGSYTLYAHLASISPEILNADKNGDGEFIAGETPPAIDQSYLAGETKALGTASGGKGGHLHFEIMQEGDIKEAAVNPVTNGLYQPDTVAPAYAHGPRDFTLVGPGPDNTLGTNDDEDLTGHQEAAFLWGTIRLVIGAYDYFQNRPRFDTNIYSIKCEAQNIADLDRKWQSETYSFETYLTQDMLGDIYNLTSPRPSSGDPNRFYYYRTWPTTDYPDGRYRLAAQIADQNQTATWPERDSFIRTLDNYAPYVKNVIISQDGNIIYDVQVGIKRAAAPGKGALEFKVVFSETMATEGNGGKTIAPELTFGTTEPYNQYTASATAGWSSTNLPNDTWTGSAPTPTQTGDYRLIISAKDLAGNELDSDPTTKAQRISIDTWSGYTPGPDRNYVLSVGLRNFSIYSIVGPYPDIWGQYTIELNEEIFYHIGCKLDYGEFTSKIFPRYGVNNLDFYIVVMMAYYPGYPEDYLSQQNVYQVSDVYLQYNFKQYHGIKNVSMPEFWECSGTYTAPSYLSDSYYTHGEYDITTKKVFDEVKNTWSFTGCSYEEAESIWESHRLISQKSFGEIFGDRTSDKLFGYIHQTLPMNSYELTSQGAFKFGFDFNKPYVDSYEVLDVIGYEMIGKSLSSKYTNLSVGGYAGSQR